MLYVLIFIIISIFFDYHYNFSSKLFDFPIDQKGIKIFLYIIYIFPVAVSTIALFLVDKLETKDVFTPIISFYATALTVTYTVYTFNKQQELRIKELAKEKSKEIKERREAEKKNRELKEKEIEANKDYYRPYFVVEENSESNKRIILLMKDKSLYLTKVKVFADNVNVVSKAIIKIKTPEGDIESFETSHGVINKYEQINNKHEIKSGELIAECNFNKFYITAETLIGETILFGYFSPTIRFYKYLKENQNPEFPSKFSQNELDKNMIENVWGNFNKTINNTPDYLDILFFQDSQTVRESMCKDFYIHFKSSLSAETHSDFLKNIFQDIKEAYTSIEFIVYKDSLLDILILYIKYINNIRDKLLVNSEDEKKFKDIQRQLLNRKSGGLTAYNSSIFWEWIIDYFESLKALEDPDNKLLKVLDILNEIFNILEVDILEEDFIKDAYLWKSNIIFIKYKQVKIY